jgi:dihydrofolate synthase/folylpolyglutamate synthase
MTYDEALAFWYSRINYEQRQPAPSDLKLDRMRALLRLLGDPHESLRIVHVAGSKGKGSTSAMLSAILRQAGYRTGLFTSPHLCRVEERFQIDGQAIAAAELADLLDQVRPAVEELEESGRRGGTPGIPTFFEVATALAFVWFARQRVDVAVLEVGLGGRFDSTNVCQPLLAIITSISYDHTHLLGDRLEQIAMEKAGIVKPGRPVISGVNVAEAREVIEAICQERQAPLWQLGVDFHYRYQPGWVGAEADRRPRVAVTTRRRDWPELELSLLGEHQAANAAVAVAAVERLGDAGLPVPEAAVGQGLAVLDWPARLEVLGRRPLVVLDCAHNVASVQALVDTLKRSFPPSRRQLVLAVSSDKDVPGMLRVLAGHFDHFLLTRYHSPRSVPAETLADLLQATADRPWQICPTPAEAWHAARDLARPDDLICITGSVFLAGELRPLVLQPAVLAPV